jgi:hypothetical protein
MESRRTFAAGSNTLPVQDTGYLSDHGSYVNAPTSLFVFKFLETQGLPPGGLCPNRELIDCDSSQSMAVK